MQMATDRTDKKNSSVTFISEVMEQPEVVKKILNIILLPMVKVVLQNLID